MRMTAKERSDTCFEISYRIKDMMTRRGHTQKSVVRLIPTMSESTMSNRMRSPKDFSVEEIMAIANVLNVSWLWLIGAEK